MNPRLTRREFLAAAGAIPLLGSRTLLRTLPGEEGPGRAASPARLPPRAVGLRTRGGNFRFDPEGLRIEPGETLRWLNMGDFHTTTAFHPDHADLVGGDLPLRIPEDADPWHSGMLGLTAGSRFEHTFQVSGVHDYLCQPHYNFGMVGRVVVGEPRSGPGTLPLDGLPEAARENMPSVERILGPEGRAFEWASRLNGVLFRLSEEGEATGAAEAVREGVAGDDVLDRHLGADRSERFLQAVDSFAEGVESDVGYEALVGRADRAKQVLRRAA